MTYKELDSFIDALAVAAAGVEPVTGESAEGIPYAYYQFPETGQQPPFICWMLDGINDLYADGINYQTIVRLVIEYYSDEKDFTTEIAIEEYITSCGMSYGKQETYLDSESMHETIYDMEIVITTEGETNNG